jgi:PAS domain S-box-containing protein
MAEEQKQRSTPDPGEPVEAAGDALRLALERLPIAVAVHRSGRALFANEAFLRLLRFTDPRELQGLSITEDLVAPESRDAVRRRFENRAKGLPVADVNELTALRRDGSTIPVLVQAAPILLADGPARVMAVTDVTEARRASHELRTAHENLRKVFQMAPVLLSITDLSTGAYLDVNDMALRVSGYAREEVLGRTAEELGWLDAATRSQLVERLHDRGSVDAQEMTFRARDGRSLAGLCNAEIIERDGRQALLTATVDITALKEAEREREALRAQYTQAQKMEAVGQLAGGLAHDLNNLLTVMLGFGALITGMAPEDEVVREGAEEITRAAQRAAALTRQLLAFSRRQVFQPTAVDLGELLADMKQLVRHAVRENIAVQIEPTEGVGLVMADRGQIEQVVLNLVVNARDAMPDGGTLTLSTANVEVGGEAPVPAPGMQPGRYVTLTVRDTGTGMDDATKARIFEPFFTTKPAGHGTGLGLASVHGIVTQSGGHVALETAPGRGTTFCIYLPRFGGPRAAPRAAATAHEPRPRGRGEKILLVEDDSQVRRALRQMLAAGGYDVLDFGEPADALALAEREAGLRLAVCDVVMPSMNGRELVERLHRIRRLPVLYVSGYAQDVVDRHAALQPGVELLTKPVLPAVLLDRVAALLEAPRAP